MGSISIKVNLRQLQHAIITTKKGTKALVIPIKENQLFEGEKGIYLDMTAWELKEKQGDNKDTHLIKQSFSKDIFEKMTDEQKKALPILGNAIVWEVRKTEPEPKTLPAEKNINVDDVQDDLPF